MMRKPIFVIQHQGVLTDKRWKSVWDYLNSIEGLRSEYHIVVVDGAEWTDCKFFYECNITDDSSSNSN